MTSFPRRNHRERENLVRGWVVVPSIALLIVLPAGSASAGGSWIEVTHGARVRFGSWDIAYASVGSLVTMRGTFSSGQQAAVSEGPWYAYLRPDVNGDRNVEPTLLSRVRIDKEGGYPYLARLAFVVPNVRTGYYWVDVCDLGCKQGVGDLVGGTVVLGTTESEARLFAQALVLRWIHDFEVRRVADLQKQRDQLRAAVIKAEDAADAATGRAEQARGQANEAVAEATDARVSLEDAMRQRDLWRLIGDLCLLGLVLAVAWLIGLRRRVRALVPNSPAGLIDQAADPRKAVTPRR
jgi:hypothetical protein